MDDINQLRKAQLYILDEIDRVCKRHDIQYFLDAGTLLGAVRHHGYIPWDDDVDIGMLKGDYDKFISVAVGELKESFFIDNSDTNPEFGLPFSKVRLKGTKYIEAKGNREFKHNEVFVDIFPYFGVSENKLERRLEANIMGLLSNVVVSSLGYRPWVGEGIKTHVKFLPAFILGGCSSRRSN